MIRTLIGERAEAQLANEALPTGNFEPLQIFVNRYMMVKRN